MDSEEEREDLNRLGFYYSISEAPQHFRWHLLRNDSISMDIILYDSSDYCPTLAMITRVLIGTASLIYAIR